MKKLRSIIVLAVALAPGGWASMAPARAAPPTVTPSPGYDARLQEQRAAPVIYQPAAPATGPVIHRHAKRHQNAH